MNARLAWERKCRRLGVTPPLSRPKPAGVELLASVARSKYGAVRTTVNGIVFASAKEAARYQALRLLEHAGAIQHLLLQPVYRLFVTPFARADVEAGELIEVGKYVGDFQYWEAGVKVVEDVKGMITPIYRLKKRLVEALYGITIREV